MKILSSIVALLLSAVFGVAAAEPDPAVVRLKPANFPTEPIEYTVVYPAGGGMDLTARLLAKYAEQASGTKILVNNRTGGAGLVGHAFLAKQAKNDGYIVGILGNLVWGDAMLRAQGKWSLSDLEAIAYINSDALTWVVSTEGPYKGKTAAQIIQIAREKPGTVRVAVLPGSMWEYLVEQIEQVTGAKFLRVPFQGGKPGVVALIGGNVDVAEGFYGEFQSFLDARQVVPVAVASDARVPNMKDVPTFNEILSTKDIVWNVVRYAVVPKGTPADRKAYLGAMIDAAVRNPGLIAEYDKMGAFFDKSLLDSKNLPADLDVLAQRERDFYVKTGRLK